MLELIEQVSTRNCIICRRFHSDYVLRDDATSTPLCDKCVEDHRGPGKFQGCHDSELAMALIISEWSPDDADDYMICEGWGFCGKYSNVLLIEDDRGFVDIQVYSDEEKAQKNYDSHYEDGWGANESDFFVNHEDYKPELYDGDSGKSIEFWPRKDGTYTENRIDAALLLHMGRTGYFPNVWDSHRYGVSLRKVRSAGAMTFEGLYQHKVKS